MFNDLHFSGLDETIFGQLQFFDLLIDYSDMANQWSENS